MDDAAQVTDLGDTVLLPIDDIKPSGDNPRKIPQRAVDIVAKSLREFGWQQPLVVDAQHVLIVGHTRWQAARTLGLQHCPVVIADNLTDEQVRAYRIADNRTHDFTSWDYPELVGQLDSLAAAGFSEVLALADWQTVVDAFDSSFNVDLPPDVVADFGGGFALVVVFRDKKAAVLGQETIMDLDGVVDIRYKEP